MLTVHHLESSRSQRIIWLLEELGVDYRIECYKRDPETFLAPASLKAIHPLGKSPIVDDNGTVLAESGAITEYLLQRYDADKKLAPGADSDNFADYLYWLHFAEGSATFPIITGLLLDATGADAPYLKEMAAKGAQAIIDHMDARLAQHNYLAGSDFSAADILNSFVLEMAGNYMSKAEHCQRYYENLKQRECYQAAQQKGAIG